MLPNTTEVPYVTTQISFICDDPKYEEEKPYYYSGELPPDKEQLRTNLQYDRHDNVKVYNVRGHENDIKLVEDGFEFVHFTPSADVAGTKDAAASAYMEELAQMLKEKFSAELVLCYTCRFRKSNQKGAPNSLGYVGSGLRPDQPTNQAHVDQTYRGAWRRARRHMSTAEAEKYLDGKWRLRIINAWKPLYTVYNHSLALCDRKSLHEENLISVDRVADEYVGEVYYLTHDNDQKWYWLKEQRADELCVFLSFDSHPGEDAPAFCAHASFEDPEATEETPPRESVEVRAIVVTPVDRPR
ncbi:hypothetical protein CC80DRAFT_475553 [Byssothecium circinans]|uniref:CmcJ-like methyltransferase n=1 Tax=Byssothecium circinans TaxID=147558 RepID=A0A6A5TQ60_9PLEO|nr:hypothetical protein CC80DRAFT_475553 [Byssothecium circinans]